MTTSVGLRCAECARGPRPVMYQTDSTIVGRALGVGLVAALAIGAAWGFLIIAGLGRPVAYTWDFWFSLIAGFGIAESVSWAAKRRRGSNLQLLGIVLLLLSFVVGRVVISLRFVHIALADVVSNPVAAAGALGLDLVTGLFLALAALIVWRRFR